MEGKSTDDWLDRWHMLHCVRIERSIKQNHFKISRAIASGPRAPFCNCQLLMSRSNISQCWQLNMIRPSQNWLLVWAIPRK